MISKEVFLKAEHIVKLYKEENDIPIEPSNIMAIKDKFFDECTNKNCIQKGTVPELPKVDMAPNDLFNFFLPYIKQNKCLVDERAETIFILRIICKDHGDNDWEDDLHLADIIDKHLGKHLID